MRRNGAAPFDREMVGMKWRWKRGCLASQASTLLRMSPGGESWQWPSPEEWRATQEQLAQYQAQHDRTARAPVW